jgi:hypothetical protein
VTPLVLVVTWYLTLIWTRAGPTVAFTPRVRTPIPQIPLHRCVRNATLLSDADTTRVRQRMDQYVLKIGFSAPDSRRGDGGGAADGDGDSLARVLSGGLGGRLGGQGRHADLAALLGGRDQPAILAFDSDGLAQKMEEYHMEWDRSEGM